MSFVIPSYFTAIDRFTAPVKAMQASVHSFAGRMEDVGVRAGRVFNRVGQDADKVLGKIFNLQNALVVTGAAMLTKKLYDLTEAVAQSGDEIGETTKRLGVNAQWYQQLTQAAKMHNVESETVKNSIAKLNKNLGDLAHGQGTLVSAFKKTDPHFLKQLKRAKDTQQAFDLLTAQIDKQPNAMLKASIAQAAYGKSGQEMVNLLADGKEAFYAQMKAVEKYGAVLSDDAIKAAMEYGDTQDEMNLALGGLKTIIASSVMPIVIDLMTKITSWIANNKALIKVKVAEWAEKLANGIEWLVSNFDDIIKAGKIFVGILIAMKVIGPLVELVFGLAKAVRVMTGAQWALNVAMDANPIGALVLLIEAMIAGVVVAIMYWEDFGAALTLALGGIGYLVRIVQSFRHNWHLVEEGFKSQGIIGALKGIGKVMLDVLLYPLQQLLEIIGNMPGFIGDWARAGADGIAKMRQAMGTMESNDAVQARMQQQQWAGSATPFPGRVAIPANAQLQDQMYSLGLMKTPTLVKEVNTASLYNTAGIDAVRSRTENRQPIQRIERNVWSGQSNAKPQPQEVTVKLIAAPGTSAEVVDTKNMNMPKVTSSLGSNK